MNYPVWHLPFPGGLLIAFIAILHVFISHFAVGGGAFLVLSERRAYKTGDEELLAYVRRHSKFFALLTLVLGAVTGVGIWFTIALISPEATSSLIHTFVWAWAIEWVFFFVEIAAALIYAASWKRLDRKTHLAIGWIYFVSAWMSLVVINGIITYMLTPGRWVETKSFWDGFMNPTYWPSVFIRTFMSAALAGVFGLVTAMRERGAVRERVVRLAGFWTVLGSLGVAVSGFWYFRMFPDFAQAYVAGGLPAAQHTVRLGVASLLLVTVLGLVFAVMRPRWANVGVTALTILAALGVMGSGEYLREFVRKPWVINGYIYANDHRVSEIPKYVEQGTVVKAKWFGHEAEQLEPVKYGARIFRHQCAACHAVDGYRAMRQRVRGWDEDFAREMLAHIHLLRGTMPPFSGNEADRVALGKYLASLNPSIRREEIAEAELMSAGAEVFKVRCGSCHTIGGKLRPLTTIQGSDAEQLESLIGVLDGMNPDMPPFTGSDAERKALATWLAKQQ